MRGRRLAWALGVAVSVLVAGAIASAFVRLPYYALAPGTVRAASPLVAVDGTDVFPAEGEVNFTTVSIRGRLTVWGLLVGWVDPAIDIVPEREILGDRTAQENRQVNLQLMDVSKQVATLVALEELGYRVDLLGTGAVAVSVQEGSAADGLLDPGDTVIAVDGTSIETADDLVQAIMGRAPGDEVRLVVERHDGGGIDEVDVVLGAREEEPDRALLGVVPQTRDPEFIFPFPVQIDTGSVGGPSAGLAFTLALIDLLTPGELTGGAEVAVTGTIDPAGNVGSIGGVAQKAAAVRRAGIDLFIVPSSLPADEIADARRLAGDDLRIVPVDDLDGALAALAEVGGNGLALARPGEAA